MQKVIARVSSLVVLTCLLVSSIAFAQPKWVDSYRKTIEKDFKVDTCSYYGLHDVGPDGSPELLIGVRSRNKTRIYVYYITKSGYVRKSSKYADVGQIMEDYRIRVYDTGKGELLVLEGASLGQRECWSNRTYEISQTKSKIVRVKEMYRMDGPWTANITFKDKYYYRGKSYSYSKFSRYFDQYQAQLERYDYIGEVSEQQFDTLNEAIGQFEWDARKYY